MAVTLSGNDFSGGEGIISAATSGKITVLDGKYAGPLPTDGDRLTIEGGVFTDKPVAAVCGEGKFPIANTDETTMAKYPYTVGGAVALVNGLGYGTFADAAAARTSEGDVITLLANITETYTMAPGETLKVAKNGKSLKKPIVEGPYVVTDSTADGITTYIVEEADVEFTATNGKVSYYKYFSSSPSTPTTFSASGTYKLLKDLTVSQHINPGSMASSVVLDLNGHTITSTASDCGIVFNRVGTLAYQKDFSVIDLSADKGGKIIVSADKAFDVQGKYNNVTIGEGVTIEGGSILITSSNNTLNVYGTVNGGSQFAIVTNGSSTDNATINIYDGAVVTSDGSVAIYLPGTGTTTISGGTITGTDAVYIKSGVLNITGGTLHGTGAKADYTYWDNGCYATGDALVVDNCDYPGGEPRVIVTGGTFISENAKEIGAYYYDVLVDEIAYVTSTDNTITVRDIHGWIVEGNTYRLYETFTVTFVTEEGIEAPAAQEVVKGRTATRPADPVKENYIFDGWFLDGAEYNFSTPVTGDITLTAQWTKAVAKIGDTLYASLKDAVAAVTDGTPTTIVMIDNELIEVTGYAITIPAGRNITIDLNGFEVVGYATSAGTSALIRNLGTLKIEDSSANGTGKLIGGADPTWTWDGSNNYSGSYASNVIRNEGNLTVESGTIYNISTGSAVYAIDNYDAGKVTINGGIVDAKKASAIRMFYNNGGAVTVTGGTVGHYVDDDNCSYMGIQVMSGTNADVTVTGGTIAGMYALYSNGTDDSSVSISGGLFDGYVALGSAGPDNVSISGGFFNEWVGTWGDQTGFITGGYFAEELDPELVHPDYDCAPNTDADTMEDYPFVVVPSVKVTLRNYTGSYTRATVKVGDTAFDNGEEDESDVEMVLRYDGVFTVSCENACAIAWSVDGGETYTRMYASEYDEATGTCTFVLPAEAGTENVIIAVVLKGDLDLDGCADSTDSKQARVVDVGNRVLNAAEFLAADIDVDGLVDSTDAKQIQRFDSGALEAFEWDIQP
ncbi:MAG: InlB B-repeat-containing protein, partial [Clostridia bacterium]|nr:InlB B-repeat-containing protein [Clostridia bacterium]